MIGDDCLHQPGDRRVQPEVAPSLRMIEPVTVTLAAAAASAAVSSRTAGMLRFPPWSSSMSSSPPRMSAPTTIDNAAMPLTMCTGRP